MHHRTGTVPGFDQASFQAAGHASSYRIARTIGKVNQFLCPLRRQIRDHVPTGGVQFQDETLPIHDRMVRWERAHDARELLRIQTGKNRVLTGAQGATMHPSCPQDSLAGPISKMKGLVFIHLMKICEAPAHNKEHAGPNRSLTVTEYDVASLEWLDLHCHMAHLTKTRGVYQLVARKPRMHCKDRKMDLVVQLYTQRLGNHSQHINAFFWNVLLR
mmetsp:Transcript_124183/g.232300  ORF Transcript_124183/g.232300 Transcript_124183/m.232300 type:complete len:216 (-) Transcript_124183:549-1196(-)